MNYLSVATCPICGSAERTFLIEGCDRLHGVPGQFPVMRCCGCGAAYLSERPADLSAYYPDTSYAAYTGQQHFSRAPGRNYGLLRRRRLLKSLKPHGGTLLDIGCGAGDFINIMQHRQGWQVEGIEPNANAVRYAREILGLNVLRGELPCAALPTGRYDVITMWHVLEHVPDPDLVLKEAQRVLKPDGLLVVGVPLADSWEAEHFKAYWAGYDVPRHLVTFTRKSLIDYMARKGFVACEHHGVVQSFASVRLSLNFRLQAQDGFPKRWQRLFNLSLLAPLFLYMRLRSGRRLSVGVFVASQQKTNSSGLSIP